MYIVSCSILIYGWCNIVVRNLQISPETEMFPQSFLLSHHLLVFIVLTHSSSPQLLSHHLSICPRSPVIAESGSGRGWGFVRKALRWLAVLPASRNSVSLARRIHYVPWRGKHGSFPVGLGLHRPNPKHSFSIFFIS